jgi:hypothetical protein
MKLMEFDTNFNNECHFASYFLKSIWITLLNSRFQGQIQIQSPEIAITVNYRIVDGHTEFPHCMLLFGKSNKQFA